jgi:hypothetical protein
MQQSMLWESNALLLLGGMKEGWKSALSAARERERETDRERERMKGSIRLYFKARRLY